MPDCLHEEIGRPPQLVESLRKQREPRLRYLAGENAL